MKKILSIFAMLILFSSVASAEKVLRIGVEGAYPPFSQTNSDGSLSGFDIDIANALCDSLNVKCKLVKQDWDGIIPALLARKYDAIIASMTINEERKKKVDFTNKYYASPARFVVRKDANMEIVNADLKGKTVGVQVATVMEKFVIDNYKDLGILKVRSYNTQDEANLDLTAGRIDLGFMEFGVAEEFLKSKTGAKFKMAGPSFAQEKWFGEGIGIAVRKTSKSLKNDLNKAIQAIRKNGTYDKIRAKYFAYDIYGE